MVPRLADKLETCVHQIWGYINIFLPVNFPVIKCRSTGEGHDRMSAIDVWVIGCLVGKPEFPPLIVQLCELLRIRSCLEKVIQLELV